MIKKTFRHVGFFTLFFLLSAFNTYPLIFCLGSKTLNYTPEIWHHNWWVNTWGLFYGVDIIRCLASMEFSFPMVFYPLGLPIPHYTQGLFAFLLSFPLLQFLPLTIASNFLILISLSAAGYASFLLARYIFKNNFWGLITGGIFVSSPIMIAQAKSHLVLLTTIFAIPLYILFLLKTTADPKFKNSLALALTAIVLASGYLCYLNMLFIFTLIFLMLKMIDRKIYWRQIKYYAISLFLFLPGLIFLFPMLIHKSGYLLSVSLSQVSSESVDFLAFFLPDVDHPLLGGLVKGIRESFINNPILHSVYLGWSVLLLSFIGIKSNFKSIKLWIISSAVFTLLSLGPVLHYGGKIISPMGLPPDAYYMPYMLYHMLFRPLVISDCSMFFILAMVFWAILATFGIKTCVVDRAKKTRVVLLPCILFLIFADFLGIPRPMMEIPNSAAYETISQDPDDVSLLNLPYRDNMLCYLYFQCLHNKKMLNPGYLRRLDHDFFTYGDNFPTLAKLKHIEQMNPGEISRCDLEAAAAFQRFLNLKYIIIHKDYLNQNERLSTCHNYIVKLFNAFPVFEDSVVLVFELKSSPENKGLHYLALHHLFRGYGKYKIGKVDEAIVEYMKAIEVEPDFAEPYNRLAIISKEKPKVFSRILKKNIIIRRSQWEGKFGNKLYSRGYCKTTLDFRYKGDIQIKILANGTPAKGIWPHMVVKLDEEVIGEIDVKTTGLKCYSFTTEVASGKRQLSIWFTNDYRTPKEDRNLFIGPGMIVYQ